MKIITRFAPSPTGMLHIGGARTALFNYLFARHHGGKFLLRIEDTDQKRSTKEAKEEILQGLKWLGLNYDGTEFYQSQNIARHQEIAQKLLETGQAYYCYTSQEELGQMRQEAEAKKQVFRFQSPWRDHNNQKDIPPNIKPVMRLKSPAGGFTIINDLVQGQVKVANQELDDLIILRSDGTPTYNLAVVVDDYDMGVTHIIRGDDHLNNSFRQKLIYQALGWNVPNFAHIPLIHGADGAKMSKRHGATNVMEYKNLGYLPQALRNYLLRLGWSHGDAEIISDQQAIYWFNLENIGKSAARFDFAKLNNLNKHHINISDNASLLKLLNLDNSKYYQRFSQAIDFIKERVNNLNDLKENLQIYQDNYQQDLAAKEQEIINNKKDLLQALYQIIISLDNYKLDLIKESILNYAQENNLKFKDFGPALRVVLTFSKASAGGIFEIMAILGKTETLKRFNFHKIN